MTCPDPPQGKPCLQQPLGNGYERLETRSGPLLVRICPVSRILELGTADWDSLELEADSTVPPAPLEKPTPFLLRLPSVRAGIDDDIATVLVWLEWAAASGCRRILCEAPVSDDKAYRHRWLTLIRGLCDEHKLEFAILEHPDTPAAWLMNRFLATRKTCCRHVLPL